MRSVFACFLVLLVSVADAQQKPEYSPAAKKWADSVFKTLTQDERIAQLMVVRLSSIDANTKKPVFYEKQVTDLVNRFNIGGICLFQGGPVQQANVVNRLQSRARTPLMVCIDAEWGVGMRITDSVMPLPKQMMLGAMKDPAIVYRYGQVVADQCKRLGIHVNYAPVVDVNNNPENPVINDRSFGENKYKVADFGIQYIKGMQDNGVMACAKHFPGHGDVSVDSHYDLPVINKSMAQLDSLELYPFRRIFDAGVGSAMIAHLYIPAIDKTANRATSLSKANVTGLLRNQLGFNGLTFTDALEMKGVSKFFAPGDAAVESLIAGNDMLCLPEDVPLAIERIKKAIKDKRLSWKDIEYHTKKVLLSKYAYGIHNTKMIDTTNIAADLNRDIPDMRVLVAENAITLISKKDEGFFPLSAKKIEQKIAYVGVGLSQETEFAKRMKSLYNASVFLHDPSKKNSIIIDELVKQIADSFDRVVIGIHNINRSPVNNFGLKAETIKLVSELQKRTSSITYLFGNPYAAKNWCNAANFIVCYEDDPFTQLVAADMLSGKLPYKGTLPVTICSGWNAGYGLQETGSTGMIEYLYEGLASIDSVAEDAIKKKAMPGCVILAAKNGTIIYHKAFGKYTYDDDIKVTRESIYDLASITKICATTIALMKLYDEGKIELHTTLGDYLAEYRGTSLGKLRIDKLLLHQAGLVPYIPFFKETLDSAGAPVNTLYTYQADDTFSIKVANQLFLRKEWKDTIYKRILQSEISKSEKYIYSDNDFMLLGRVIEEVSGMPLDEYVRKNFYIPMSLSSVDFNPLRSHPSEQIVPTEREAVFRRQLISGTVHDPGAAMLGGVAGHAGLFGNARDLACIMQMLLNGGVFNNKRYLEDSTVKLFTEYNSRLSRRGLGFDKPEKDNSTRKDPYPARYVSPETFGHTGFTGTAAWADPKTGILFIFLSNRVYPDRSAELQRMNVRGTIHDIIYASVND